MVISKTCLEYIFLACFKKISPWTITAPRNKGEKVTKDTETLRVANVPGFGMITVRHLFKISQLPWHQVPLHLSVPTCYRAILAGIHCPLPWTLQLRELGCPSLYHPTILGCPLSLYLWDSWLLYLVPLPPLSIRPPHMAQLRLVMSHWILSEVPSSSYDLPHIYNKIPSAYLGAVMFPFSSF